MAATPPSSAAAAATAQHFAELFPALVTPEPTAQERDLEAADVDGAVDVSIDDLVLRPLEREVDAHLYDALQRWNAHVPAGGEATMPYMQRLKKYRAIVRWMLYEDETPHPDDEGPVVAPSTIKNPTASELRRLRKQQQKTRRTEIAKYKHIFSALPPITTLRALRRPSAGVERFLAQFPPKKRVLSTKRSVADTQTAMCFEFARRATPPTVANHGEGATDAVRSGDENEHEQPHEIQRPTATTAATWRSRTLLASMEEQQQRTDALDNAASVSQTHPSSTDDELVLWVDVLHASKDPARTQSFLVLGSHTLSDVLDLVVCAYDQRFDAHGRHARLLYFDTQFYVARRNTDGTDYSNEILAWIYATPARVAKYVRTEAPVTPKALESTTFAELALKIDTPGVYIHQGECEHVVRLRDVRLLNAGTDATANRTETFPMRLPNQLYRQLRSCLVCSNYSAKFVCYGDRMASTDPMFYCDRCFRTAHYDRDGQLLFTDFQAFPFIQE